MDDAARLKALFRELAGGRIEALGELYDACAAELYGLALWNTGSVPAAEDVVQDVFVRLADRPDALASVESPRAYLLAITYRAAIDRHRARTRRPEQPLDEALLVPVAALAPERGADARHVTAALRALPSRQRAALYLHFYAELSYTEIARVTKVPTFTAASRCREGLRALRRLLEVPE
ncbi:MAG: RNA polymerase sigma factor [Acidobacteria bacterium]|nr:RNA polymerase sigma factor [Acidobacteriota bacterium]